MRILAFVVMAMFGSPTLAEDATIPQEDVTGFEACFIQLMIDNPDNAMLEVMGPIVCGERHVPMGQSCDALGYMLFDRREACKQDDLVFWQAQVETRAAAAVEEGRSGVGMLHLSGLQRCQEELDEGPERLDCKIEINWRTSMEFIAADLIAELVGDAE
ncbi:hypothetical protein [Octadecabacter ascidiaceicola]|uniref:Lysozyme inhibitor LprI N-terminal domain-containing protein n=1 Tax=Octadecabacter ascidiaceicola TaxID=1655543 RepID=A0A238JQY9_9RHOB|nr:hypothetical protein [Octadecabacter ascidiaceicola]SMX32614.1 hypothetical protein OCA8868_00780 [Octadecabacter ascidiaceicola]